MSFITSIFDDEEPDNFSLWNRDYPNSSFRKEKRKIQGFMVKKAKHTLEYENKWFVVTDKHIWYKVSKNEKIIRGWIDLEWVRVEFIPKLCEVEFNENYQNPILPLYGFR